MDYFTQRREPAGKERWKGQETGRHRADGAALQRDQREWVLKPRRKGLDERCPSCTQAGGWGRRGHLERTAQGPEEVGTLICIRVWRQGQLLGRCSRGGFEGKDGEWNSRGARNRSQVRMEHMENQRSRT